MNSGTGWTKRRAQPAPEPIKELVKTPAAPRSRRVFVWTLAIVVIIGSAGSALFLLRTSLDADHDLQRAITPRNLAEHQLSLLTKRLGQEKAYRAYAATVADTLMTDGREDFSNAPTLDTWAHNDPTKLNAIVNKQHPIKPLNFVPTLVDVPCGLGGSAEFIPAAQADFTALCDAAAAAGSPLLVTSSYRSYADQGDLYLWWISSSGAAQAERVSALPGYSEHQLGLSVDFATPGGQALERFAGTPQQVWLSQNAWRYGFIQRYHEGEEAISGYAPEVWHFRYVGRVAAETYQKSGALSLEQFWGISGGSYSKAVYKTMPADAK